MVVIKISNFYLCDYCRKKTKDLGVDVLCEHTWFCEPKKPMHDGIEPTDVCEHYERREGGLCTEKI